MIVASDRTAQPVQLDITNTEQVDAGNNAGVAGFTPILVDHVGRTQI
jgi:hypothetical protein